MVCQLGHPVESQLFGMTEGRGWRSSRCCAAGTDRFVAHRALLTNPDHAPATARLRYLGDGDRRETPLSLKPRKDPRGVLCLRTWPDDLANMIGCWQSVRTDCNTHQVPRVSWRAVAHSEAMLIRRHLLFSTIRIYLEVEAPEEWFAIVYYTDSNLPLL